MKEYFAKGWNYPLGILGFGVLLGLFLGLRLGKEPPVSTTHECIQILKGNGEKQWEQFLKALGGGMPQNKTIISVGKKKATMYTVRRKEGDIYVAYNTTYFFNTCSTKNKKEFLDVISSLR